MSRLIPDVKLKIKEMKGRRIILKVGVIDGDFFLCSSYWGMDIATIVSIYSVESYMFNL